MMKVIHEHYHYHIRQSCLGSLLRKFNVDPKFQYKLHLVMTYFWAFNMVLCVLCFILLPVFWAKFSIFYILFVSLYANFATDYGAVPGAEAAISTMVEINQPEVFVEINTQSEHTDEASQA